MENLAASLKQEKRTEKRSLGGGATIASNRSLDEEGEEGEAVCECRVSNFYSEEKELGLWHLFR